MGCVSLLSSSGRAMSLAPVQAEPSSSKEREREKETGRERKSLPERRAIEQREGERERGIARGVSKKLPHKITFLHAPRALFLPLSFLHSKERFLCISLSLRQLQLCFLAGHIIEKRAAPFPLTCPPSLRQSRISRRTQRKESNRHKERQADKQIEACVILYSSSSSSSSLAKRSVQQNETFQGKPSAGQKTERDHQHQQGHDKVRNNGGASLAAPQRFKSQPRFIEQRWQKQRQGSKGDKSQNGS